MKKSKIVYKTVISLSEVPDNIYGPTDVIEHILMPESTDGTKPEHRIQTSLRFETRLKSRCLFWFCLGFLVLFFSVWTCLYQKLVWWTHCKRFHWKHWDVEQEERCDFLQDGWQFSYSWCSRKRADFNKCFLATVLNVGASVTKHEYIYIYIKKKQKKLEAKQVN